MNSTQNPFTLDLQHRKNIPGIRKADARYCVSTSILQLQKIFHLSTFTFHLFSFRFCFN